MVGSYQYAYDTLKSGLKFGTGIGLGAKLLSQENMSSTMLQNRVSENKNDDLHSGIISEHHRVVVNRKIPRNVAWKTKLRYQEVTNTTSAANPGVQGNGNIAAANTNSQAFVGSAAVPGGAGVSVSFDHGGIALMQLQPYMPISAANIFASVPLPLTNQFYVSSVNFTVDITNLTSAGVLVDLYCVTPRMNTATNPLTDWSNSDAVEALGVNQVVPVNDQLMEVGSLRTDFPGARPQHDPEWRKRWRILKVVHNTLAGNGTANINLYCALRAKMRVAQALAANGVGGITPAFTDANLATDVKYMANKAVMLFLVFRGQPALDPTAVTGGVTYAESKLGCNIIKQYVVHPFIGKNPGTDLGVSGFGIGKPAAGVVKIDNIVDVASTVITVT